ncbi:MAG TPA: ADP-glyceromanno-heptose 6-epimerase [Verrucomicrobiae bacterium]|jgi:ADP-L-glycero-D-manno-heptose 6-epimerase|nr:ADP-glyceromanno-heptose 6-epimerase [Verrucomicrobiae bacterium]
MKNVLITGGAGFIGSNLALEIQSRYPEAHVTVLDDFRVGSFKNLIGFRGDVMAYDVADKSWVSILAARPLDTVFHLASITDTTVLDEKKMMFDNVEGFRNVLELAHSKKADVVFASSAAVYGSQDSSMKESDGGKPNNIYGFSKWVLESLARSYEGKLKVVGVRYFNVFGPREYYKGAAASMIYQLTQQMLAGKRPRIFKYGEQKRDHIYVKDVVECTLKARLAKENTVVNVGTGEATSFNEIIAAINEGLGTSLEPDYFDNPYDFYQNFTQADMSHTRKAIGFERKYSTHDGIVEYVRQYLLPASHASAAR